MAARLPKPGEDHSNWGEILNEFLSVSHTQDGKLKTKTVGTTQLQDGAVSLSKLDTEVRSLLRVPGGALSKAARHDQAVVQTVAATPLATTAAVTTGSLSLNPQYYAPEDYGCATNASAEVNDAAIAAAIKDAVAGNGVVQFIGRGQYNISKPIDQDVTKFVVRGNKTVLNLDNYTGPYMWSLYSSAEYQYSANQGVAISGIILQGAGLVDTPFAMAGIQIGHATYTNNSLFSIENVYIQGFAIGLKYIQNAWRIKVVNSRITGGTAILAEAGLANFGENMLLENCMIESFSPKVTIGTGEWSFINCSFNACLISAVGNCVLKLQNSHLEPHTIFPCVDVAHPQAMVTLDNVTLIIDPNVDINNAAFNVISTNTTFGLIVRNLDTIQSARYTPQVNSQNCVLVSGGGRVDMQGLSSNLNGNGYAIASSNNLIYNGGGEKGTTAGWTTYATYGGQTTFTADSAMKKYGAFSLKLTASAGSIYVGQAVPCSPGKWVMAQCWNKLEANGGSGNTFVSIDFLNAKNEVIQTTGYVNTVGTAWWACRRLSGMNPIAPAGTVSVRVYIGLVTSTVATAWYDDIIVNVV